MRAAAQAVESAEHWERLAAEADRMAVWETEHGRHPGAYPAKAQTYRDAARASRLEADTGLSHCCCCFKPVGGGEPYWKRAA